MNEDYREHCDYEMWADYDRFDGHREDMVGLDDEDHPGCRDCGECPECVAYAAYCEQLRREDEAARAARADSDDVPF